MIEDRRLRKSISKYLEILIGHNTETDKERSRQTGLWRISDPKNNIEPVRIVACNSALQSKCLSMYKDQKTIFNLPTFLEEASHIHNFLS